MKICSSSEVLIVAFLSLATVTMTSAGSDMMSNLVGPTWTTVEDEFLLEHDEVHGIDGLSEEKRVPHEALYKDVEAVISELPAENSYIREALQEAVAKLHHADDALEKQALTSLPDELTVPAGGTAEGRSFLCSLQKLIGFSCQGSPDEKVQQRTAAVLPSLRGAAKVTEDLLAETRRATERGFDVLKFDLYEGGVPKTPEAAKKVAQRIVDAAKEDREKFLQPVVTSVGGIKGDVRAEDMQSSAKNNPAVESGGLKDKNVRVKLGFGIIGFAGLAAVPQILLLAVLCIELPRSMGMVDLNVRDLLKGYRLFLTFCAPEAVGLGIVFVVAVFLRFHGEITIPNDPVDVEVWEELKAEWPVLMGGDTLLNLQSMLRLLIFMSAAFRAGIVPRCRAKGIVIALNSPLSGVAAVISLASMLARARLCTQAAVYRPEGPLSLGGHLPYFCDLCSVPFLMFVAYSTFRPNSGSPWCTTAAIAFAMWIASQNYLNLAHASIDFLFTLAHVLEFFAALAFLGRATMTSIREIDSDKHGTVLVSFVYMLMAFQQALAAYYFFTHFDYSPNLVGTGRPFGVIIWSNVFAFGAYLCAAVLYLSGLCAESPKHRKTSR
mmetsp:Transcript_125/g.253  ORF Transcript_125/g.253 Transcript_125/m.253 type:complete len:607 (+) Transcript_125:73-1893(+)